MTIDSAQLKQIIEGALLASGQPLDEKRLLELFVPEDSLLEEDSTVAKDDVIAALDAIAEDCQGRGFELKRVSSGWRFQVREETAPWVNRLWEDKPQKYSRAMLETLALIAYRQPITRGDIEEIRGVAVSSHIIKTLTERDWVKVVGHRDVPGRPSLFATTRTFLDYFNLSSLEDLPSLGELADLDQLNSELNLDPQPIETTDSQPQIPETAQTPQTDGDDVDGSQTDESVAVVEQSDNGSETDADKSDSISDPLPQSEIDGNDIAESQPTSSTDVDTVQIDDDHVDSNSAPGQTEDGDNGESTMINADPDEAEPEEDLDTEISGSLFDRS